MTQPVAEQTRFILEAVQDQSKSVGNIAVALHTMATIAQSSPDGPLKSGILRAYETMLLHHKNVVTVQVIIERAVGELIRIEKGQA